MTARTKNKLQTFHATMIVTRTEEWCVDATSVEEAKARFSKLARDTAAQAAMLCTSNWASCTPIIDRAEAIRLVT